MTQVMPFLFFDDLFSPLDFILSEHDCQLQACEHIEELVEADRIERLIGEAAALVAFFADDLVLHHRDEEEDLFRLLSARCRPEDGLAGILAELEKDHTAERFLMRHIVLDLRAILVGRAPERPAHLLSNLRAFAAGQRRHLPWENDVVVPLGRVRLEAADLQEMARGMATRRRLAAPA